MARLEPRLRLFSAREARAFLPAEPQKGDRHEVPQILVIRLARFHLVDNVHALNYTVFPEEAVEKARLTATVDEVEGDLISLSFEGETRASFVEPEKIGFTPKLMGNATFDLSGGAFASFELVAVGTRWGLGSCNGRRDPAPALMGIVFTLAGDSPAERLPPAFLSRYGW